MNFSVGQNKSASQTWSDKDHPWSASEFCGPHSGRLISGRHISKLSLFLLLSVFKITHLPRAVYKKILEAADSLKADLLAKIFMTGNILCAVLFEEDVIIDILECEIFE